MMTAGRVWGITYAGVEEQSDRMNSCEVYHFGWDDNGTVYYGLFQGMIITKILRWKAIQVSTGDDDNTYWHQTASLTQNT